MLKLCLHLVFSKKLKNLTRTACSDRAGQSGFYGGTRFSFFAAASRAAVGTQAIPFTGRSERNQPMPQPHRSHSSRSDR